MPKGKKSEIRGKWAPLLKAVRLNKPRLAGVKPFQEALERAYSEALFNQRAVDVARKALRTATQRRNETLDKGYDADLSLRHFLKSVLGTRSEELIQYGMKPRGPRRRREKRPDETLEQPS